VDRMSMCLFVCVYVCVCLCVCMYKQDGTCMRMQPASYETIFMLFMLKIVSPHCIWSLTLCNMTLEDE